MTAFYSVLGISPKLVSLQNGTTRGRFEKCHNQSAQNTSEHLLCFFQHLRYMEPAFQNFHIVDPRIVKQMCFWTWWRSTFRSLF